MAVKYEVRWIFAGSYRVDEIEADDSEKALEVIVQKIEVAKDYRIISVKRMDDSSMEIKNAFERARISA